MGPEWLIAFASLVGALGWPVAIVVVVVLLRKEISQLLARVEGFDFAGSRLSFKEKFENKIEQAEETFSSSKESAIPVGATVSTIDATMRELVSTDPAEAMWVVWRQIRDALDAVARSKGIVIDLRSMRLSTAKLQAAGLISHELAATIQQLHSTYRSIARSYVFGLDTDAVLKYVELAAETRDALKRAAAK